MTSLPRFSVNNPVLINLMMLALIIGGAYRGLTMVREMFPESRPSQVLISTTYPGATPAEVEKGLTLKIEEKIKDVDGVERILSTITEGYSTILVEMRSGFGNIDQAVNDIKAAIDTIPDEDLPEEARETRVSKFEPRWPVISVALFGGLDERTLKNLGQTLKDDILALPGVTNVVLSGTRKDEISVEVSPDTLVSYGLSLPDIAQVIRASNLDLPGGQVRTPRANVSVRTLGETDRGDELLDLAILSDPAGRVVHLREMARVVDGFEDVDVLGRFNGQPSVNVTVYKTPDQDAIAIAGVVRALVAGKMDRPLQQSRTERLLAWITGDNPVQRVFEQSRSAPYPAGIGVEVHSDLSRFIEGRLDLLKRNGLWGLLLVTLSLLFFLHWRVAFWVMAGLVLAVAGALIFMSFLGQTLNLMTMFGLIIVLGLLVDDAIIVSEHVYSKIEKGIEPRLAAISGAEEVSWPVFCCVTTTVVAFVPLMFIEGQIGDWMGVLPVIVCIALAASLFESLAILPSHLATGLKALSPAYLARRAHRPSRFRALAAAFRSLQDHWINNRLRVNYERLVRLAVARRYVTMAALTGCLIAMLGAVAGGHVPFVFLQKMDSETVVANLKMDVGTPKEKTLAAAMLIEQAALELPERRTVYTLLGTQLSDDGLVTSPQSHLAQVFIELTPGEERDRDSEQIIQTLRSQTFDIPGARTLKFSSIQGGPGGAPIHLEISGDKLADLVAVADEIQARLATFDGVFDIVDDYDAGRREVQISLFDSARALGMTTESLATQVRAAFYGFEARTVQREHEDVKIMVRFPPAHRTRVYDIESMRVAAPRPMQPSAAGIQSTPLVPFTEVARLTEGTGFASIKRKDQRRTVTVTADVDTAVTKSDDVIEALTTDFVDLQRRYPGVAFDFGGQKLETAKSFGSLKTDFAAALILIYVILAGLFRSYIQPAIVMAAIPFGLIGAVAGHYVMGYPLTILSTIGLVALTGIVVNDSLVLITFVNRRVRDGEEVHEAVIQGGLSRLRPILLTSITTVLGMAPLLSETSFQARFLIPMGISISAGLIFATVLTLLAVPALYMIVFDVQRLLERFGLWNMETWRRNLVSDAPAN